LCVIFSLRRSVAPITGTYIWVSMFYTDMFYLCVNNAKYVSCDAIHELKPGLSTFLLSCGSLTQVEETIVPKQAHWKHSPIAHMNFGLRLEKKLSVHFHCRILASEVTWCSIAIANRPLLSLGLFPLRRIRASVLLGNLVEW
jgi:hypothetical protein